jgi:hypothetical protein
MAKDGKRTTAVHDGDKRVNADRNTGQVGRQSPESSTRRESCGFGTYKTDSTCERRIRLQTAHSGRPYDR